MRNSGFAKPVAFLCGCLALLPLVGCDSSATPTYTGYSGPPISSPLEAEGRAALARWAEAHPLPTLTGAPLPVPVGTVVGERVLSLATAWGMLTAAQLQHFPLQLGGGYQLQPVALSRDGRLLVGIAEPPYPADGSPPDRPMILAFMDLADRQLHSIATMPNPRAQPTSIQSDGAWIVWAQDDGDAEFLVNSEVYAYNLKDRSTHRLVTTRNNKADPPALAGAVQIDHGQAVWAVRGPSGGDINLQDLATGQITLLATNGFGAQIAWPNVAWIDSQTHAIVVLNRVDGTRTTLVKPWRPVEFALAGDAIAWTSERRDRITLTNLAETVVQPLTMGTSGSSFNFTNLQLNDRFVIWSGPPEVQLWDRRQNALVRPTGEITYFHVFPQRLMWVSWDHTGPQTAGEIHILDTSLLR